MYVCVAVRALDCGLWILEYIHLRSRRLSVCSLSVVRWCPASGYVSHLNSHPSSGEGTVRNYVLVCVMM